MFPRGVRCCRLHCIMGMLKRCSFLLLPVVLLAAPWSCLAQEKAVVAQAPDSAATLAYIHQGWDELSRSMTDCHSLVDVKVTAAPVLYMPAELAIPAAVRELTARCGVKVAVLPKRIEKLGDLMPGELTADKLSAGLLYLPHQYVVPGGRFNEMYGWDSYFIILGLIADHRGELARGMVENFWFEIEHYGAVLNANRTYFLTRSQPPFLTSMMRAVYEDPASFRDAVTRRAWLETGYAMASKDYETWIRPEHKAGTTGLARYWDYGAGPVPEMEDDSTYYPDVIRWLVQHPAQSTGFLLKGAEHPDANEIVRLKKTSCDVTASLVCMKAEAEGYRLTREFYEGDRAMRESGFDTSFRFGAFSGATHHYAPVCLNSLLFRYERDMAHFAHLLGKASDAHVWEERAKKRDAAIQRYLWSAKDGTFTDYDFVRGKASTYDYVTSFYPLWAGVATREQAAQVEAKRKTFERPGGLAMSDTNSGMQWDEPFGWAPTNWLAVAGLAAYQFKEDAKRVAKEFSGTVDRGFAADGTIREKYNVEAGYAEVHVTAGYKANAIGFGWTNGVYLKMAEMLAEK
jgi:alpha,alpha-trehalase